MLLLDLISALAMLDDAAAHNTESTAAEVRARSAAARRRAMMQRSAFGLAAGPV